MRNRCIDCGSPRQEEDEIHCIKCFEKEKKDKFFYEPFKKQILRGDNGNKKRKIKKIK